MIKFIVCEDNSDFLLNNCQIINQVMMKSNTEYKIIRCNDYIKDLKNAIKSSGPKIFIIDLELPTKAGLDIAREIRNDDYYSQIIISSAHYELENLAFKSKLMILDFVSKYDNHDENLTTAISHALNALGKKVTVKVTNKTGEFLIEVSDIVYMQKENLDKKCLIVTRNGNYTISKTLCELEGKCNNVLVRTHRSCLINPNHIKEIDYQNSIITFNSGMKLTNMISRNYRKKLQKAWQ